jgi:choline-sulfatase
MIRVGQYKYVHYGNYEPQLFDLGADPEELDDLAGKPEHAGVLAMCRAKLFEMLDPADVDRRARARQAELLALHGGKEAVIARGDLGFTPAPGVVADFQ